MINDFNNGAVGWTDWNILLDETGGPNHVKNFCLHQCMGHKNWSADLYKFILLYRSFLKVCSSGSKADNKFCKPQPVADNCIY